MHARIAAALLLAAAAAAQPADLPRTRPERSGGTQTSTCADVEAFLGALGALPNGARVGVHALGRSLQGRTLRLVAASLDHARSLDALAGSPRLRALIVANIHGGEVEGKEAVQMLLREIALGEHADILEAVDLLFVPVFNADGNDRIDAGNRTNQNGPDGGVGQRANAQELDLNRDFVKAQTPEVRALLAACTRFDPHLLMDLHTTNGSHHGYHPTYATSLATSLDADLERFAHEEWLPEIRARSLEAHGLRVFDYGNFERGRRGEQQQTWVTYGHEARYGINYHGLRNRLSLLSEAYSYLPFDQRIAATRGFVLESLRALARHGARVRALCAQADARCLGSSEPRPRLGFASELVPAVDGEVLVGSVERVPVDGGGERLVAKADYEARPAKLQLRFCATQWLAHPQAWAVPEPPPALAHALLAHGVEARVLRAPLQVHAEQFVPAGLGRGQRAFQGHRLVTLSGALHEGTFELPAGTLLVPARQRLARVAALLLEARSEDSLATWGVFDGRLHRREAPAATLAELGYPVLRVLESGDADAVALRAEDLPPFEAGLPYLPAPAALGDAVAVRIVCVQPGRRTRSGGFESEVVWADRVLAWEVGGQRCEDADALAQALRARAKEKSLVMRGDAAITAREYADLAAAAKQAGFAAVYLETK
jgi:hypothetical protein